MDAAVDAAEGAAAGTNSWCRFMTTQRAAGAAERRPSAGTLPLSVTSEVPVTFHCHGPP